MTSTKKIEEHRIMRYVRPPRIREFCSGKKIFKDKNGDDFLYMIYRTNDSTYPDVGRVTTKFYNKPMFQYYWGRDTLDYLEKFACDNESMRDEVVDMVEDLLFIPDIESDKTEIIEDIFEQYKIILKPVCDLYEICYYVPTLGYALDVRVYEGKPTIIKRSLMVKGIIGYLRHQLTKERALGLWNEIAQNLLPTETIEKMECVKVREHVRHLNDKEIKVRTYPRLNIKSRVG